VKAQMSKQELVDLVKEAQEKLFEVIELLDGYVKETDDGNASAYIVDHLSIIASRDHGFCSHDLNLDDIVDRIESELEDDEDEGRDAVAEYAASNGRPDESGDDDEDIPMWARDDEEYTAYLVSIGAIPAHGGMTGEGMLSTLSM